MTRFAPGPQSTIGPIQCGATSDANAAVRDTSDCVHFIGPEVQASGPCSQLTHNLVPLGVMGKIPNVRQTVGAQILRTMGFISVIFIGLIVGTIAKLLMPGKDPSATM